MKESSVRKKRKRVEKGLNVKQGKSKKRRRESEVPESKEECVKAPSRPVSGVGTVDAKPQGGERQSVQSNTFADRRVTTRVRTKGTDSVSVTYPYPYTETET